MKRIAMLMVLLMSVICLAACSGDLTTDTPGKLSDVPVGTTSGTEDVVDPVQDETDPSDESAHSHEYSEIVVMEATCTDEGLKEFVCIGCDDRYSEAISALGHDASEATCTEAATCYICSQVVEEAWGHRGEEGVCDYCGAPIVDEPATPPVEETPETPDDTEPTEPAA